MVSLANLVHNYMWPRMAWGLYGSSRYLTSSSVSVTSTPSKWRAYECTIRSVDQAHTRIERGERTDEVHEVLDTRSTNNGCSNLYEHEVRSVKCESCMQFEEQSMNITPSLPEHHARAIWAMLTPFFFASSSTLRNETLAKAIVEDATKCKD